MKKWLSILTTFAVALGIFVMFAGAASANNDSNAKGGKNSSTNATVAFTVPVGYTIDPNDPSKLVPLDKIPTSPKSPTTGNEGTKKTVTTPQSYKPKHQKTLTKPTGMTTSTSTTPSKTNSSSTLPQTGNAMISPVVLISLIGASLSIVAIIGASEFYIKKQVVK